MAQPVNYSTSDRWSSLLSRLNPVPGFEDFTGPYKVGTVDIEIPVTELESPAPAPENTEDIETVQFRIFYPTGQDAQGKKITWLPAPQREYLCAYIQFLNISPMLAQPISYLPRHLHYTSIPVVKNAPVLEPNTPNGRWPTAFFSHGLGGSRNAYSQIVGSLASHGVVVICPEHRDGSSVVSYVRIPSQQNRYFVRNTRRVIPYRRLSHTFTDEVYAKRNDQLRIRLWEMGLIHEATLAIDKGSRLTNLNKSTPTLETFVGKLHVHEPGSIIFAGHSFGSATMVQFLKSVFYAGRPELAAMETPLFVPSRDSAIYRQVTPRNVTILLDMWCVPLLSKTTKPLADLPLPQYAKPNTNTNTNTSTNSETSSSSPSSPGGNAILAVESSDFFGWQEHLQATARLLSPDPSAPRVSAQSFYLSAAGEKVAEPHFFYVEKSAHLSQSDFGVLFPWLMRRYYRSEEPERALRLNRRALLQVLRVNGVPVARTWCADLVDGALVSKVLDGGDGDGDVEGEGDGEGVGLVSDTDMDDSVAASHGSAATEGEDAQGKSKSESKDEGDGDDKDAHLWSSVGDKGPDDGIRNDIAIFDRGGHSWVNAWRYVDIVGMGEVAVAGDEVVDAGEAAEVQEPEMAGVIDPRAAKDPVVV
ncbi:hypothetical protein M426DRAFT_319998 [Hypoxylon sp. CI-4A]|nr:hypothetical protein M426DRAFT_319998 [Hypoxylon sp. CI-4A]